MNGHYLEFLIDKCRMEKKLKGISEKKFPDFSMTCQIFQKKSLTFQVFRNSLKKDCVFPGFPGFPGSVATLTQLAVADSQNQFDGNKREL